MTDTIIDQQYYQVAQPQSLGERVVIAARDRIYVDFLASCQPDADTTILDVGVSDVINDAANVLERRHPHPHNITAVGLGEGDQFCREYPAVAYHKIIPGMRLPFADQSFDIATSNAVLEHVGSTHAQAQFVAELVRVAKFIYITVPHRYFPIEHHTAIPLLHYFDASFRLACRLAGKPEWTEPANLILMSSSCLKSLVPRGMKATICYTGLKLGPFSSNLALTIDQRETS